MQNYMVAKGDTLWMIAKKFGISLEELIKANPQIKDPNKIREGDAVKIPLGEMDGKTVYTVQSGDTMWSIARKFNVSLDALLAENNQITDADLLSIGWKIMIPAAMSRGDMPVTYRVQSGDTLWSIARKYNISLEALIDANPQISDESAISPGQMLQIPATPPMGERIGVNNGALYFVKSGDTFFHIAQRYALPATTLIKANPQIADKNHITPGMQLYLPGFHHVKSGETLYAIAMYYRVPLEDLIRVNPQITDTDAIAVGDKIAVPRQECGDIATYTVKPGDTLYKIVQKYNVPVEAVLRHNRDITASDLIYPGQMLQIPGPHLFQKGQTLAIIAELYGIPLGALKTANPGLIDEMPSPQQMVMIPTAETGTCRVAESDGVDYIVQRGDTMSGIAAMYRVSLAALVRANPQIADMDDIKPGMIIHVPTGFVECVCHTVRRGDTVWKIAARYGMTANALLNANPQLEQMDHIVPGQVLMIPIRDNGEMRGEEEKTEVLRAITYPEIYVARRGDTLDSVALQFGTSVKQLRLANEALGDDENLVPGQQLVVLPSDMVCEYRCLECPWLEQGMDDE